MLIQDAIAKATEVAERIEKAGGRYPQQFDVEYAQALRMIVAEAAAIEAALA